MLIISQTALELGFMYALVAMALFLSYRILDIADMTTDGCFVLGAAVSVTLSAAGHPFLALPAAMLAGACAGFVTAFLQTRLGVPSILAGIVTNTGLYTINLMVMGWKSNFSLLGGTTIFTLLRDTGIGGDWYELLLAAFVTILVAALLLLFLRTRLGGVYHYPCRGSAETFPRYAAWPIYPRDRRQSGHGARIVLKPELYDNRRTLHRKLSDRALRRDSRPVSENRGHKFRHWHCRHRPCLPNYRRNSAWPPHGHEGRHRRDSRLDSVPLHLRDSVLHQGCPGGVPEASDGGHSRAGDRRAEHQKMGGVPAPQARGAEKGRELTCLI